MLSSYNAAPVNITDCTVTVTVGHDKMTHRITAQFQSVVYTYTSLAHLFSALPPPPLPGRGGGQSFTEKASRGCIRTSRSSQGQGQRSMVKVKSQG